MDEASAAVTTPPDAQPPGSANSLPSSPVAAIPAEPPWGRFETLAVWFSLLAYSLLSAPIPALNEPHYLTKARHYWQSDWCRGDFFLESVDAHVVFYQTIGVLTLWLPLPAVAVIGRLLALGIVAVGWTRLVRVLISERGAAFVALWIFLALQAIGNWSGEWVVGGVESKVFAYGFLFWSLAAWCERRVITAATLAGLAIAFHPVVGVWGVFAMVGTMFWECTGFWPCRPWSVLSKPVGWARFSIAVNCFVLAALPGLIPAVRLITAPVDHATRYAGTYLQVYYRLAHHLDPMLFPQRAYVGYLVLILAWVVLRYRASPALASRRLQGVILFSLLFAVCGLAIGYGPRPPQQMLGFATRMQLLKFYPFRLADILIPCGVAWGLTELWWQGMRPQRTQVIALATIIVSTLGYVSTLARADRITKAQDPAWQEICQWFRETQPAEILVQTPHDRYTFKWYAERPEYVTFKDCPQDAPGIVEWNRRMLFLAKWYQTHFDDQLYSASEMQDLHQQSGITHVVTGSLGPFEMSPVMEIGPYRVYDLRSRSDSPHRE